MTQISATQARSQWFDLMRKSAKGHRVFQIQSKEGGVVLLSQEDYDSLLETLELLSTPGFLKSIQAARKEIKEGKVYSMAEVFGD